MTFCECSSLFPLPNIAHKCIRVRAERKELEQIQRWHSAVARIIGFQTREANRRNTGRLNVVLDFLLWVRIEAEHHICSWRE
jgi:hypothetical protein